MRTEFLNFASIEKNHQIANIYSFLVCNFFFEVTTGSKIIVSKKVFATVVLKKQFTSMLGHKI